LFLINKRTDCWSFSHIFSFPLAVVLTEGAKDLAGHLPFAGKKEEEV
jgi:hypothetical protein